MTQSTAYKILKEISECEEDLVYRIMGDFGLGLKTFISNADLNHPELSTLFEEFYTEDGAFLERCFEFIKTIKYAKQNGFNTSVGVFEEKLSSFFKGKLLNKMSNIRLLKNSSQRHEMRSLKKCKVISLDYLFHLEQFWAEYPECFSYYERDSVLYESKIIDLLKKKETYLDMGLSSLAEDIERDIEDIKNFSTGYYGFRQINSTTASIVLARLLSFSFNKNGIFVENKFKYCPFICPLEEIPEAVPSCVKDKITYLEGLPEAGGKPVFDIFALIVPTCCDSNQVGVESQKDMIRFFLRNKIFKSVLVGEKSNNFYFIDLVS